MKDLNDYRETIGQNLKVIRKKWGFNTQDEFVNFLPGSLRVSAPTLSTYERGRSFPGVIFMVELQRLTGINVERLCTEPISPAEIPEQPITYQQALPDPMILREPTYTLDEENSLYYLPNLILQVRELERRLQDLERGKKKS
jgi:transcriptional regulator with XRE-family HTH domain